MRNPASLLLRSQAPGGAFLSHALVRRGSIRWAIEDHNCFATAQVLRALDGVGLEGPLEEARRRALEFLRRCASPSLPGAYRFWPAGRQPKWAPALPDDADDSAVSALELLRAGRLDEEATLRTCALLVRHRLRRVEPLAPPWLRPGVFVTWLEAGDRPNVVDCCVNANVIALLAFLDLRSVPGYEEACVMVEEGVRWAGTSEARARGLCPFYPDRAELWRAVGFAIRCGARELEPAQEAIRRAGWVREEEKPGRICGSAYGRTVWTSPAVTAARALAGSRGRRAGEGRWVR